MWVGDQGDVDTWINQRGSGAGIVRMTPISPLFEILQFVELTGRYRCRTGPRLASRMRA